MTINPDSIILGRLSRELEGLESVALGGGLPSRIQPLLPATIRSFILSETDGANGPVDAVVVEALQISDRGDLVSPESHPESIPETRQWIVATSHTHPDGQPKLVRECNLPLSRPHCVKTIITELGVIQITDVGLVLTEVAPGVSTDDVKLKTNASLHIADDIRLMEF